MSEQSEGPTHDAPKGQTFTLRLEGGGVIVEREVDEATALDIITAVMGRGNLSRVVTAGHAGARTTDLPRSSTPRSGGLAPSARGYIEQYEAKRNVDKILALAAYIADTREHDTVTPDDVKREFRNAAEPVPGNYARDFRWAVQNDWLALADGYPGEYYVTSKGRDALKNKFSADVKKGTGVKQTSRRKRTSKKKAEDTP